MTDEFEVNPELEEQPIETKSPHRMRSQRLNTVHRTDAEHHLKSIKQGMTHCLSSQDGILLFQHIMSRCGFHRPSVTANPQTGEMFNGSTLFFEGQRAIWLELRQLISRDKLVHIENPEIPVLEPVTKNEDE